MKYSIYSAKKINKFKIRQWLYVLRVATFINESKDSDIKYREIVLDLRDDWRFPFSECKKYIKYIHCNYTSGNDSGA